MNIASRLLPIEELDELMDALDDDVEASEGVPDRLGEAVRQAASVFTLGQRVAELEGALRRIAILKQPEESFVRFGVACTAEEIARAALSGSSPLSAAMMEYAQAALVAADAKDAWCRAEARITDEEGLALQAEVDRTADIRDAALARVRELRHEGA